MTTKEKKTILIKEVITPAFREAGFSVLGQTYYRAQGECCMVLKMQGSRFNSPATGNTFWFHIMAFPKDTTREQLKEWNGGGNESVHEDVLLPDCGYLHPYHNSLGYHIDGYKNYKPQDMDIEEIKERIGSDFRDVILPQLATIRTIDEWKSQKEKWERYAWEEPRILLLRFFSSAQMLAAVPETVQALKDTQRRFGLSAETIKEQEALYHAVQADSAWPDDDKWAFLLSALE